MKCADTSPHCHYFTRIGQLRLRQNINMKHIIYKLTSVIAAVSLLLPYCTIYAADTGSDGESIENNENSEKSESGESYIKYIDFDVTASAMSDAADIDIETHNDKNAVHVDWITLLSLLGAKYGGDFSHYKKSDLDALRARIEAGETPEEITQNPKLYSYYLEAYGAALGGMLGEYTRTKTTEDGTVTVEDGYGLRAFSPIAKGYYYSDYDDFGASRSFGYRRPHLGHDMMGSVGTPIIAVESGYVEALGWNMYGGWRCGIRSFDGKRYYYYAHLRRGHPYANLYEGQTVMAGEVIGYLGMTGYSRKEDVNGIETPHLHIGLQIIFDQSQKDGWNQIWLDMYELCRFLYKNRAATYYDEAAGERVSREYLTYSDTPD